ncbi:glycosyltransferase family 4 protein [Desertihabitans brevis]|uniref:glycosyltransferase family 4 protein n=1 Tax=Desertihabitans brevis TaxID=2268447 RepID=UPI00131460C3|nr:glycosyltransferase family 4 protein [Desertihabitans brevis]
MSVDTAVTVLTELLEAGEYDAGVRLAELWWDKGRDDPRFLTLARQHQGKRGEVTAALRTSLRLAELGKQSYDSLATLEGRLRELTGEFPHLGGPVEPVRPASPHRVLHLTKESRPYLSNGFTSRSHYNFLAEREAGLEPVVVTEPGFPRDVVGDQARREMRFEGIGHYHLDVGPADAKALPLDRYLQLFADLALERVRKIRPAVIHASSGRRGYETALVALAVGAKLDLPVVYEVRSFFEANWTADLRYEASGELYEARRHLELQCMQRADLVLTIGDAMRSELVARGLPEEKVGVVPNGVDVSRFSPRPRDEDLARQHGIAGVPTFGYVSNMDHYRENQEALVQLCARLHAEGRPEHCVLVGDGPRRASLEQLATQLGVAERVHFTGRVDHDRIPDYYSLIDVFVVPRVGERASTYVTPLKPFEAMAMGVPVVVSSLPALVEIADPPVRGWSYAEGDLEDLAHVVTRVLDDAPERERRVRAAADWILRERQWLHNGPRYREYFRTVTEQRGS